MAADRQSMPIRRRPVVVERIALDDLVLVVDGTGVYYARVHGHVVGGLRVVPLERPGVVRRIRARDVADHWQRAPRAPAVSPLQLPLIPPDSA